MNTSWIRRVAVCLPLSVLVLAPPALAATVARVDLDAAVAQAARIVHGDVVGSHPLWSDDALRIYTDVQVRVRETLKGSAEPTVTVRLLGGEIGTIGQMVPGAPRLLVGEEVVLLLQPAPGAEPTAPGRIVGLSQGLYRVKRPPTGAPPTAHQESTDVQLVEVGKQGPPMPTRLPLDDLLVRIRTLTGRDTR